MTDEVKKLKRARGSLLRAIRSGRMEAPPGQRQLAQQYRVARAQHVKELQRQREDAATSCQLADDLQMDLALVN